MRKVALVTSAALLLVAAVVVGSGTAAGASSTGSPHHAGPRSGAGPSRWQAAPGPLPSRPSPRVPATASPPVACDAGFDTVVSPNVANFDYLVATATVSGNDAWAVGNTFNPATSTGSDQTLAEHWNGTNWTIVPTPNPGPYRNDLTGVSAVASNDVWAVGFYQYDASGDFHGFAEHWDGNAWNLDLTVINSIHFTLLLAVTAVSATNLWAVGTTDFSGNGQLAPLAEKWDGSSWTVQATPNPGGNTSQLFSVSAFAGNDIWAVGSYVPLQSGPSSLAEHYDGTNWSIMSSANANGDNEIIAVTALEANHAVGVGYGNFVFGFSARTSEAWDLTTTSLVGPMTDIRSAAGIAGSGDNALIGVDRSGGNLWAGGYWRSTPTGSRESLAVPATWNASTHTLTWGLEGASTNPSGVNNVFEAISAISPNAFWASGYETNISNVDQTFAALFCALKLQVGAPLTTTIGSAFSVTITIQNPNSSTATGYAGTVHFTSNDPLATLPPDYTFVPADSGMHTFVGVVLRTPYTRTITVADAAALFIVGSVMVTTRCPGACQSPGGTPSSRGANQGPPGKPSGRGTSQSPPGAPRPPRIPASVAVGIGAVRTVGPGIYAAARSAGGHHDGIAKGERDHPAFKSIGRWTTK